MKILKVISAFVSLFLLLSVYSCTNKNESIFMATSDISKLVISFDFEKQSGNASNQFAVWIEDMDGKFIKTLYATRFTANGGYKNRPEALPTWVEKSNLVSMNKTDIDAITSATPETGFLYYIWDLTDKSGNKVPISEYSFFVEGNLRWNNRILYSGTIKLNNDFVPVTAQAKAEFIYEASDGQPALSKDSPENEMIGPVTANFQPGTKN